MNLLPPVPWHTVAPGTVVLIGTVPRTVLVNTGDPATGVRHVLVEGVSSLASASLATAQPVELDETDAMLNLFGAGFTPEVINP